MYTVIQCLFHYSLFVIHYSLPLIPCLNQAHKRESDQYQQGINKKNKKLAIQTNTGKKELNIGSADTQKLSKKCKTTPTAKK
jgi:hypothetical protein